MAGLLFHAIEHRISARRVDHLHGVSVLGASPRLADPHPEIGADVETVFPHVSIRPSLEAQTSDPSHDRILEGADVASISIRGSNGYT
jgi:hypothetical protein